VVVSVVATAIFAGGSSTKMTVVSADPIVEEDVDMERVVHISELEESTRSSLYTQFEGGESVPESEAAYPGFSGAVAREDAERLEEMGGSMYVQSDGEYYHFARTESPLDEVMLGVFLVVVWGFAVVEIRRGLREE